MSTTTPVKQKVIGAQRLYNAIKQKNVSLVGLFMMSHTTESGAVQNFDEGKVWDAWREAPDADILHILWSNPTLRRSYYVGRRYVHPNNIVFSTLRQQMPANPSTDQVILLRECVKVMAPFKTTIESDFAERICEHAFTHDWPFTVIEQHIQLKNQLLTKAINDGRPDIIEWCIENRTSEEKFNSSAVVAIIEHKRFDVLTSILTTEEQQRVIVGASSDLNNCVKHYTNSKETFNAMMKAMPWLKEYDQ